jgi:hypothetical protein
MCFISSHFPLPAFWCEERNAACSTVEEDGGRQQKYRTRPPPSGDAVPDSGSLQDVLRLLGTWFYGRQVCRKPRTALSSKGKAYTVRGWAAPPIDAT